MGVAYAVGPVAIRGLGGTLGLAGMVEDALGVVHLQFDGWAQRDETARFLWDLPFYEPWFLVLGVLVTLGAVHPYRRTGGSARAERRFVVLTALARRALTAFSRALVVARSA